ncbi:ABC transporter permease [Sphaerobacter thermophilus]|jgi:ABC-2 type transport system permease protein|uniref:ABC transporter permease n=1 Tax=Sphaerobacter thermophilus TaxID=2057 RepID=UPI000DB25DD3|nr:MAG: hypothetical protein DIU58_00150 [Sphaerobacter thermophilus]
MKALRYMVMANLKMTVRNRAALFWLLAFPVIFIVLFGFLIGNGDFNLTVGVVGGDINPTVTQVVEQMRSVDGFSVNAGTEAEELAALNEGDRDIVIVFGPGASPEQVSAKIYYNQGNPQESQVAVAAIRQFFSEANQAMTDAPQPIVATVEGVDTENVRYIDFLVPGILAMSIMTSGLMGLSSTFVSYRERGILRRIKATPFSLWSFIGARIFTQVLIAMAQAVIVLSIAVLLFDVKISGDLISLLVMIALGSLAFLAIGFFVSGIARNQEVADSVANAISFPMMFLGGVFFPIELAPAWMQPITKIIPLTYFANGLRDIMIQGDTLFSVWSSALVMLATAAVGVALSVRFFRWEAQAV